MSTGTVAKATLGRLPRYLQYLKTLPADCKNVSATTIAKELGLGDVQVRKDLAAVCSEGRPKIGYITNDLIKQLEQYLGQNKTQCAVIVGAGKLGKALLDYEGFADYGLNIIAAFDKAVDTTEYSATGKPIYSMSLFETICQQKQVRIGIIVVPKSAAQQVCDRMIHLQFSAIWNFAPISLRVPKTIAIQQENLALSLAHLTKQI